MQLLLNLDIFRESEAHVEAAPLREERLALAVRRFCLLLKLMFAVWLGFELAALGGHVPSPFALALAGQNPFWAGGFFGITFLYFWSRPSVREFRGMVAGGLSLSALLYLLGRGLGWQAPFAQSLNVGLGLGALVALLGRALRNRGLVRTESLAFCLPALLTMGATFILAIFFRLSPLQGNTLDAITYAAEQTLGGQPSFALGRLFKAFPPLAMISMAVYLAAQVPLLCVLGLQMRSPRPPRVDIYTIMVAIAVVFTVLCTAFPVVGPVFAFGAEFPHHPPEVDAVLQTPRPPPDVPRNCMPSGHTAWALLVWWQARPFARWVRGLALGNLVFTVLATLGFGLHYLLDLVVAMPAAVAIQAACTPVPDSRKRWQTVICGAALAALWLAFIRWGRPVLGYSVLLTDAAALATVIVPFLQEQALYRQVHTVLASEAEARADSNADNVLLLEPASAE